MIPDMEDFVPVMSDREFRLLSGMIYNTTGINITPSKKGLLVSRLAKRLNELGVNFSEYYQIVCNDREEFNRLIDRVSTNKTEFFRECSHFKFLATKFIEEMRQKASSCGERKIRVWSAACSTGEEPYSIAITLLEALRGEPGWNIRILASDICTEALNKAKRAIYDADSVRKLPAHLWYKYLLKGIGQNNGKYRFKEFLRRLVEFHRINLKDDVLPVKGEFDAIFLRNVLIYFDRPTQQEIVERLSRYLRNGGYLFLGHSESLQTKPDGLRMVAPSVYLKSAIVSYRATQHIRRRSHW